MLLKNSTNARFWLYHMGKPFLYLPLLIPYSNTREFKGIVNGRERIERAGTENGEETNILYIFPVQNFQPEEGRAGEWKKL